MKAEAVSQFGPAAKCGVKSGSSSRAVCLEEIAIADYAKEQKNVSR